MRQTKPCPPTSLALFPSYTSLLSAGYLQAFRIILLLVNSLITQFVLSTSPHPVLCLPVKMYECGTCDFEFRYREDCDAHMDEYDHWVECETCSRQFRTEGSCEQHMDALDHRAPVFECETCPRQFRTERSCEQHMDALDHREPAFECETCTRTFSSQAAANQHMNVKNHWEPTVSCETCSQMFHTHEAADQHMEAEGHYENYCAECDRRFMNENCLRQV